MKKIIFLFAFITLLFCFSGCNDEPKLNNEEPKLNKFEGISFSDASYTYDGETKKIEITGNLPEGAEVSYTDNEKTNAGTYTVSATVSKEGYESLTLTAELIITPALFTGITFDDAEYTKSDTERQILISYDTLPEGTLVTYENNKATQAGVYHAVATVTNPNYQTLVLQATLTIRAVSETVTLVAGDIINALMNKPDPWRFLPTSMLPENMAYSSTPLSREDFADFVNVDAIGTKSIGKQLNVLYDTLTVSATALTYVDAVFSVSGTIASLYQTYLNNDPNDQRTFSGEAGGFQFLIQLDGNHSKLLAGNTTVNIELTYNSDTGERMGRIEITNGVTLKYQSSEEELHLAYTATISGIEYLTKLDFVRNGNVTVGHLYEHLGAGESALKTSALIEIDSQYTRIMADKRETDDLLIDGYQEVYNSQSGVYVGGIVDESVKLVDYKTLWLHLSDISGIDKVKVLDDINNLNADTVYINNMTTAFVPTKIGGLSLDSLSRRYDIEMKDVWYVVAVQNGEKVEYQRVKTQIPMLFVQTKCLNSVGTDIKTANSSAFASTPVVNATSAAAASSVFETMLATFTSIKAQDNYSDILAFIGSADAFFDR